MVETKDGLSDARVRVRVRVRRQVTSVVGDSINQPSSRSCSIRPSTSQCGGRSNPQIGDECVLRGGLSAWGRREGREEEELSDDAYDIRSVALSMWRRLFLVVTLSLSLNRHLNFHHLKGVCQRQTGYVAIVLQPLC